MFMFMFIAIFLILLMILIVVVLIDSLPCIKCCFRRGINLRFLLLCNGYVNHRVD